VNQDGALRLFTRRRLACIAVTGVLGLLSFSALIAWHTYRGVSFDLFEVEPASAILSSPEKTGIAGLEQVSFMSRDGLKLAGWYVPSREGAAVVLAGGTNSDRSSMLPEISLLAEAGFGVLAFDWPGLGKSAGQVRWDAQARHALTAAVDWLASQPGVDARRLGGLGFSIGGHVMTQVAAQDPRLSAVVLEAPPSSFKDFLDVHSRRWGFLSLLGGNLALRNSGLLDPALDPLQMVGRIAPRPLLIIGGTVDTEIPPKLVVKMYAAAGSPKSLWIIDGAGHGNYKSVAAAEYTQKLSSFFAANLRRD
jgi:dipeptidyl aminopeptidase/acylaminoacyl peptidase